MNGRCTTCGEWDIDDLHECQAMTKTTAEVKRWDANGPMDLEPEGSYVLHSDYATLQQKCRELTECVLGLVKSGDSLNLFYKRTLTCNGFSKWVAAESKALALIGEGGEKGVGT